MAAEDVNSTLRRAILDENDVQGLPGDWNRLKDIAYRSGLDPSRVADVEKARAEARRIASELAERDPVLVSEQARKQKAEARKQAKKTRQMPKSPGRPKKDGAMRQSEKLFAAWRQDEAHRFGRLKAAVKAKDVEGAARLRDELEVSLRRRTEQSGYDLLRKPDKNTTADRSVYQHAQNRLNNHIGATGIGSLLKNPDRRPAGRAESEERDDRAARAGDDAESPAVVPVPGEKAKAPPSLRKRIGKRIDALDIEGAKNATRNLTGRVGKRQGPIGAFVSVTLLANRQARFLALFGLVVGVLFVPVGFLTFSGWSIAALAMVIISAFYFILLNIVKAVASVIVSMINAVFSFLGGLVVKLTEVALGAVGKDKEVCRDSEGEAYAFSNFCNGHDMLGQSLIAAGELNALNIPLLDPEKLKPTMDTTPIIQKLMEWFDIRVDLSGLYAKLLGGRFTTFVETGNIYGVIAVFVVPVLVLAAWAYFKVLRPAFIQGGLASSG